MPDWKIAIFVLKVNTVEGKKFGEELSLHLLIEVLQSVPIEEIAFLTCVCVEINIKEQSEWSHSLPVVGTKVFGQSPNSEWSGLLIWLRVQIESIEILIEVIHPVMPVKNSIRI